MHAARNSFLPDTASPDCALRAFRPTQEHSHELEHYKVPIKSKFGVEFRRFAFSLGRGLSFPTFADFHNELVHLHQLTAEQKDGVRFEYSDADGKHQKIDDDDSLQRALRSYDKVLRIFVRAKDEETEEQIASRTKPCMRKKERPTISEPMDFRRVSAIVDADILPMELCRVQLCKFKPNMPLGFYIRDGISFRLSSFGQHMPVHGIFVSRLVDNGIAASTNLLHPDDEILEVNGIDVSSKTLDQVTDIMIANSYNLILTVRPSRVAGQSPLLPFANSTKYSGLNSYYCTPPFGSPSSYASATLEKKSPFKSFSRNTTVRLSDKLQYDQSICARTRERPRRPFSLYAPNV